MTDVGDGRGTEYRLVFSVTCTFLYYYDLVTSLEQNIQSAYDKSDHGHVDITVTTGQRIGKIGGQTLDFAVWDTEKPLKGFITPSNDDAEPWKIFTADPLDYYTPELRQFIRSRYGRTAGPVSGRIDYDVDGRLIGNWFMDGTDGYGGVSGHGNRSYWTGHLSFVPDVYDPTAFVVSIGDCDGQARQFAVKGNAPNPADVSPASGLTRYDLVSWSYQMDDGTFWEGRFKCQDLADESAILVCGIYIDLNQIRAGEARTPEASLHTSAFTRIAGRQQRLAAAA